MEIWGPPRVPQNLAAANEDNSAGIGQNASPLGPYVHDRLGRRERCEKNLMFAETNALPRDTRQVEHLRGFEC